MFLKGDLCDWKSKKYGGLFTIVINMDDFDSNIFVVVYTIECKRSKHRFTLFVSRLLSKKSNLQIFQKCIYTISTIVGLTQNTLPVICRSNNAVAACILIVMNHSGIPVPFGVVSAADVSCHRDDERG